MGYGAALRPWHARGIPQWRGLAKRRIEHGESRGVRGATRIYTFTPPSEAEGGSSPTSALYSRLHLAARRVLVPFV